VIVSLRGLVQRMGEGAVTLELGGVGVEVSVPRAVIDRAPSVGEPLFLYTRMIVREDSIQLFGFDTLEQRELFDLLLQVSGVGPRLALGILSHLSPDVLRGAVANNQPEALDKVPGIGRKSAEKIVFFLKDRLQAPAAAAPAIHGSDNEVLAALTTLGYTLVEAQRAVQAIPDDAPDDVEERLRLALRHFARG
jgi:Holliday junction DNA helicase RuvA